MSDVPEDTSKTSPRDPHQADVILRAFRYQLLQTILWWLDLGKDEELWIEVSEDLSVASPDGTHDVQVKFSEAAGGPSSISLRTAGVREAIARHWERSEGGTRPRRLTILARAGAAREKGAEFPAPQTGLEYWASVALDGDIRPLRTLLQSVFDSTPLGDWLATNPSDQDVRNRLLTRVHFAINSRDDAALEEYLRDRLAAIYLEKRHLASAADQGMTTLIDRVFKVATLPEPASRRLTSIDLHEALEQAIPKQGTLDQVAALIAAMGQVMPVGEAPEPSLSVMALRVLPSTIDRKALVADLHASLRSEPIVWLKGSNGIGKSTLATLLARARGGCWLVCDFRPSSKEGQERGALAAWRELMIALNRGPPPAGIVLDDLSLGAADLLKARIAGLAEMLAISGGQAIITSNHNPSGAFQRALGIRPTGVKDAPYFSLEEVRELVSNEPAPKPEMIESWANLVHLATIGGHPFLTVAKIADLRARGWPDAALMEDLGPKPGAGIAEARLEARLRLISETTAPQARALLNRVGSTFTMFDDALATELGNAEPALANPGDVLAQLKGSWIEPTSGAFWRLSPLIGDLVREIPATEVEKWRRMAAEHWMKSQTLDQWTLPLAFWNGYLGKHLWVLLKLGQVILTLRPEKLRATGIILSPLAALPTKTSLFPDEPLVASMLRLIQLRVADATEDEGVATASARAWLREINSVPHEGIRNLHFITASQSFFDLEHVRLPADTLLEFLIGLQSAIASAQSDEDAEVRAATRPIHDALPAGADPPGFYLTRLLMRAQSSEELEGLLRALDALDPESRMRWLQSASRILQGDGVWVHNPWAKEQLADKDLVPTFGHYERMREIVANWGDPKLEAEFVVAQSVLLDEGLNDPQRAILVVEAAMTKLGGSPALVRQKYKVLHRRGEDAQAAEIFLALEPELEALYPFDRMLAIRDGAISLARAGRLADARRAFAKARDILEDLPNREDLRIGLLLEQALVAWKQSQRRDAMQLLAGAFEELGRIEPAATRQGQRALRVGCAMAIAFANDVPDSFSKDERLAIAFGQPSQLELMAKPESAVPTNLRDGWSMLLLAEAHHEQNARIEARAQAAGIAIDPSLIALILRARFSRATANRHIQAAVALIEPMIDSAGEITGSRAETPAATSQPAVVQQALTDIVLAHALTGEWNDEAEKALRAAVKAPWGDESLLTPLLEASHQPSILARAPFPILSCSLVDAIIHDAELPPGGRFVRDLYLVQATAHSLARRALEPLVVQLLVSGWRGVLQNQGFLLISPRSHAPAIQQAVAAVEKGGLRAVGDLFSAAASAVNAELSPDWKTFLERLRGSPA